MCLSNVKETYDPPSELIVDGWKVFAGSPSAPQFENFAMPNQKLDKPVPLDEWMQASAATAPTGIRADDGKTYMPGFHVYSEEAEIKKSQSRRVYIRRVTCMGSQTGKKCVIAQEMYVPSNQNAWPPLDSPVLSTPPAPGGPGTATKPPKPRAGQRFVDRIKKAAGGKP
jgi:hypothetical protein